MPISASGPIKFSELAQIVNNNNASQVSLGSSDVRYLIGVAASVQLSLSGSRSKPGTNSYPYTTATDYTLIVPAYQTMSVDVRGGGQGGNGGTGSDTCTGWCGQYCFFPFCCNGRGGDAGGSGGESYLRFTGIDITADGGTNAAAGGGRGGTVTTGGGGGGGSAGTAFGCSGAAGSVGKAGGRVTATLTKGSNGPGYGASVSIRVGGGGGGGFNGGGGGGTGYVGVSTS